MVTIRYAGAGRFVNGIPATDLTSTQLAVLARKRGMSAPALRAQLVASGLYAPAKEKRA